MFAYKVTLKDAGLFQTKFGSNMEQPNHFITRFNPAALSIFDPNLG